MKYSAALLTLVTAASAVDLYLHSNNDCGGSSLRCNNAEPNTCCGTDASNSPYQSIAARGLTGSWNVQARGYDNGRCNRLQTVSGNNGNLWICNRSNGFRYTGAGYNFVGRRRAEPVAESTECKRPDALVLPDGTEFDLTSLNDDDFNGLVELGLNATGSADVPQQLRTLQIN